MQNLRTIVRKIHAQGAMVALGQIGPLTMYGYRNDYQRIAEQENAVLIKDILQGIFGNPKLMNDHVHPNTKGYATLAQKVYRQVKPVLEMSQNVGGNR